MGRKETPFFKRYRRNIMKKATAFLAIVLISTNTFGQDWDMPRTPDGQPDMQGIWSNASQTPLVRPEFFGTKGFLTEEEAREQMQVWSDRYNELGEPIDGDRAPPTDGNSNFGYNSFWWDPRTQTIEINGEYRTSIIIDPPDGQIPYIGGENPRNDLRSQWRARPGVGDYHGHEVRPLAERCLLTFGSGSGPPMLPILYNNNYQIVQTPDYVMILVEMVHDARIIPLNQEHNSKDLEKWMGDSIGYWDGDTLIVLTRNFHPQQSFRGSSGQMIITERFDLLSKDKIKYAFTIEDPLTFSRPWTGEVAMNRKPVGEAIYEYACHEGNYAFPGIMGGARRLEIDAAVN